MPNTPRFLKRISLEIGTSLLIIAVLFVAKTFIAKSANSKITEIIQINDKFVEQDQIIRTLATLKQDFATYQRDISLFEASLPSHDKLLLTSKEIKKLAVKNNLIPGFAFGEEFEGNENSLPGITFQMTLRGTGENILAFLHDIEIGPYVSEIDSVEISGNQNDSSASIRGKIFGKPIKNN